MQSNQPLLNELFATDRIEASRGAIFDSPPPPLPTRWDFDRAEGMMLGLAIGDALGAPTESNLPAIRRQRFGEISNYVANRENGKHVGIPSDDSQLAFWTLEHLLAHDRLVPERLADDFCQRRIFGIGTTVREFTRRRQQGLPWLRCGPQSAGNGALMRIAPVIIPHLAAPSPAVWSDVALAAMITHNDRASTAACVALADLLWKLIGCSSAPDPESLLDRFVDVARSVEGETTYQPRGGHYLGYRGPLWRFVDQVVREAHAARLTTLEACNRWHSGAYLLETVPCVLYILLQHQRDPEQAIIRAVNDTKDNDTVAAIVGAAVGALHGSRWIPASWRDGLLGRTTADDDGHIFELLAQARQRWSGNG